jgi:hypothetical protein
MDEMGARALMERLSVTEPPPSRVDIALARQRGAQRLRRRRWAAGLAPLAAAAAVAAIIAGTGALSRAGGLGGEGPKPVSPTRVTPPHRFDPLAPYAAFGWLPKGVPRAASGADSLPTEVTLGTSARSAEQFTLTVWAPGTCNLDAAQVSEALRDHRHPQLNCMQNAGAGSAGTVDQPEPPVRGRPAFSQFGNILAWEYARDSWATLMAYRRPGTVSMVTMLRVAAGVRYAATKTPSVRFPYQLTGIPAAWRATSAGWRPSGNDLLGESLDAGLVSEINVTPGRSGCWFDPGSSRRITLDGLHAVFTLFRERGVRSYQGLCVPETDGLSVSFLALRAPGSKSYPLGGVTGIFLHHLRLLGPDPANWTTHPLR